MAVAFGALPVFAVIALAMAGVEKVTFPAYQAHVLYDVLDRRENKEVRELYVNPGALKSLKAGQPLPGGTGLSTPTVTAVLNDKGELVKDAHGRLVRGRRDRIVVMEKRTRWGAEYASDLRNGEWEYARFDADGTLGPNVNLPIRLIGSAQAAHNGSQRTEENAPWTISKLTCLRSGAC